MDNNRDPSRSPTCKYSLARDSLKRSIQYQNSRASSLEDKGQQEWRRSGSITWAKSFEPFGGQINEIDEDQFNAVREIDGEFSETDKKISFREIVKKERIRNKPCLEDKISNKSAFIHSKTMKSLARNNDISAINKSVNSNLREEVVRQFQEYNQKQKERNQPKRDQSKDRSGLGYIPPRTQTLKQSLLRATRSQKIRSEQKHLRQSCSINKNGIKSSTMRPEIEQYVPQNSKITKSEYFTKTQGLQGLTETRKKPETAINRSSKPIEKSKKPMTTYFSTSLASKDQTRGDIQSRDNYARQSFQQKTSERQPQTSKNSKDRWSSVEQVQSFAKDLEVKFRDVKHIDNNTGKWQSDKRGVAMVDEKTPQWYNSSPTHENRQSNTNFQASIQHSLSSRITEKTKLKPGKQPIYLYNKQAPGPSTDQLEAGIKIEVSYVNPTFKTNTRISIPLTESLTRQDLTRHIQETTTTARISNQPTLTRSIDDVRDAPACVYVSLE